MIEKIGKFLTTFGRMFEKLVEHHQLVRRLLLVWFVYFASLIMYRTLAEETITPAVATIFTTFLGFFTVIVGIYQWSRKSDAHEQFQRTMNSSGNSSYGNHQSYDTYIYPEHDKTDREPDENPVDPI